MGSRSLFRPSGRQAALQERRSACCKDTQSDTACPASHAGHKFQPIRGLSHDRATVGAGTIHTDLLFRLSGTTRASAAGTVWSCACQTVLTLQRNPAAAHMSAQQMLHDTIAIVGYGGVCRWCTCSLKLPKLHGTPTAQHTATESAQPRLELTLLGQTRGYQDAGHTSVATQKTRPLRSTESNSHVRNICHLQRAVTEHLSGDG